MELAELKKKSMRLVDGEFNGMPIVVNANAITSAYCREAARQMAALEKPEPKKRRRSKNAEGVNAVEFFEGRGKELETACEVYATLIKGGADIPLLVSWDLTRDGEPVGCSIAEMKTLHLALLRDLWTSCLSAAAPKEQETRPTPPSRTISETSGDTSPILETQEAEGQSTSIS